MALRKNQNFLSATEKKQFTDAVIALKDGGSSDNKYDELVHIHEQNVYAGHFGPAFFPWHREFLTKFEQALQSIKNDQSIALPYWNWAVDNPQTPGSRSPFTADFLGTNGQQESNWQVKDGPFNYDLLDGKGDHQWPLDVRSGTERYPYLRRQFGPSQKPTRSLPTWADVLAALQATPYDVKPWDQTSPSGLRTRAEGDIPFGMHNLVHMWVGGSMVPMTSPNDPVFWLHHCFMDRLWTDWQMVHQDQAQYLPDGGDPNDPTKRQKLNDPMPPWNTPNDTVTPANVLSTWNRGYHYDTDGMLLAGEVLYPGQGIHSASVAVAGKPTRTLMYDTDGVLKLYVAGQQDPYWWSDNRRNENIGKATLESNGNLVIYGTDNKTKVWQSYSWSNTAPCYLVVRPDGYVSILPPQGPPIWTRPTKKP